MNIKRHILLRVRVAFVLMFIFAVAIVAKIVIIQFVQGEAWKEKARKITYQYRPVKATRGNIYSDNGSLLATSLPFYKVAFDPTVPSKGTFDQGIDSLSIYLSKYFHEKSAAQYKNMMIDAREQNRRYLMVSRRLINYHVKKEVASWPIFREGRYGGGVIFERVDKRFQPFENLSKRTVGFINENERGAGLEYSFNDILSGQDGEAMFQKISGSNWKPVFDGTEIRTIDGDDIETTIDVNLQDVAETALEKALRGHEADFGLVVVMEVETGEIKAMSNLTRVGNGYRETYNYAVGSVMEPGSTIKLATALALMEETPLRLTDIIDTGDGSYKIYNSTVRDHHEGGWGKLSFKEAFEKSSNVAMVKLVDKHFGLDPNRFLSYLDKLHLTHSLNFQIMGGGVPKIPRPEQNGWSGITLPWMAHGYGLEVTPLHILTLFNAVANNGKMIRPIIVRSMGKADRVRQEYKAEVLEENICSRETLARIRQLLEGVVENGTASNVKGTHYRIAGKTGTAQLLKNGRYTNRYMTSFAGYFPAGNPKYSAIVVVRNPKGWRQYGSNVAAPVFKEIADNIYSRDLELHGSFVEEITDVPMGVFPVIQAGNREELSFICNELGVSNHTVDNEKWVKTKINGNAVQWHSKEVKPGIVPDVRGMTLRDAIYLLETAGMRISHRGIGRVEEQSVQPNAKVKKGELVILSLG
ncbi:MAG: transpeptidase family protein [Cyclobacteriaceae bacterium]|nr:transpeptidase family protein [Cyclobacteriaceae bacterium]